MKDTIKSLLTDKRSTNELLREHINITHEMNRLIATHPCASAETLSDIIDFWGENDDGKDSETCALVIANPNTSFETLMVHGHKHPDSLLQNPLLMDRIKKEQNILNDIPGILGSPNCPVEILDMAAKDTGLIQKSWLLLNPTLSESLQNRITANELNLDFSSQLDDLIAGEKNEEICRYLNAYKTSTRRYCIPRYVEFDRDSNTHRKKDQIFAGFPFTSSRWTWPTGKNGRHMQPIVQLDIKNSEILLQQKLGSGLLQVWGGVDSRELITRTIPASDLDEPLDHFYPDDAPWLSVDSFGDAEMEGCMISPFPVSDYHPFDFKRCGIEWVSVGNMYYPSLKKRVFFPIHGDSEQAQYDQKLERRLEKIDDKLDELAIPTGIRQGTKLLCMLGGYTDGLGSTWTTYSDPLLFYHSLDDGIKTTIGITYHRKQNEEVEFTAHYTIDN